MRFAVLTADEGDLSRLPACEARNRLCGIHRCRFWLLRQKPPSLLRPQNALGGFSLREPGA